MHSSRPLRLLAILFLASFPTLASAAVVSPLAKGQSIDSTSSPRLPRPIEATRPALDPNHAAWIKVVQKSYTPGDPESDEEMVHLLREAGVPSDVIERHLSRRIPNARLYTESYDLRPLE